MVKFYRKFQDCLTGNSFGSCSSVRETPLWREHLRTGELKRLAARTLERICRVTLTGRSTVTLLQQINAIDHELELNCLIQAAQSLHLPPRTSDWPSPVTSNEISEDALVSQPHAWWNSIKNTLTNVEEATSGMKEATTKVSEFTDKATGLFEKFSTTLGTFGEKLSGILTSCATAFKEAVPTAIFLLIVIATSILIWTLSPCSAVMKTVCIILAILATHAGLCAAGVLWWFLKPTSYQIFERLYHGKREAEEAGDEALTAQFDYLERLYLNDLEKALNVPLSALTSDPGAAIARLDENIRASWEEAAAEHCNAHEEFNNTCAYCIDRRASIYQWIVREVEEGNGAEGYKRLSQREQAAIAAHSRVDPNKPPVKIPCCLVPGSVYGLVKRYKTFKATVTKKLSKPPKSCVVEETLKCDSSSGSSSSSDDPVYVFESDDEARYERYLANVTKRRKEAGLKPLHPNSETPTPEHEPVVVPASSTTSSPTVTPETGPLAGLTFGTAPGSPRQVAGEDAYAAVREWINQDEETPVPHADSGSLALTLAGLCSLVVLKKPTATFSMLSRIGSAWRGIEALQKGGDVAGKFFHAIGEYLPEAVNNAVSHLWPCETGIFRERYSDFLKRYTNLLTNYSPTTIMYQPAIRSEVKSLYTELFNILKTDGDILKSNAAASRTMTEMMRRLDEYMTIVRAAEGYNNSRRAPYSVWFYGQTRVGKSALLNRFVHDMAPKDIPPKSLLYARCRGDEFWSGYWGQFACVFDDIYTTNEAEECHDYMQCCSHHPYMLNMPSLSSHDPCGTKGTCFTSKLVVAASNALYPIYEGQQNVEAMWARRHLVWEMQPSPQYRIQIQTPTGPQYRPDFTRAAADPNFATLLPHLVFRRVDPAGSGQYDGPWVTYRRMLQITKQGYEEHERRNNSIDQMNADIEAERMESAFDDATAKDLLASIPHADTDVSITPQTFTKKKTRYNPFDDPKAEAERRRLLEQVRPSRTGKSTLLPTPAYPPANPPKPPQREVLNKTQLEQREKCAKIMKAAEPAGLRKRVQLTDLTFLQSQGVRLKDLTVDPALRPARDDEIETGAEAKAVEEQAIEEAKKKKDPATGPSAGDKRSLSSTPSSSVSSLNGSSVDSAPAVPVTLLQLWKKKLDEQTKPRISPSMCQKTREHLLDIVALLETASQKFKEWLQTSPWSWILILGAAGAMGLAVYSIYKTAKALCGSSTDEPHTYNIKTKYKPPKRSRARASRDQPHLKFPSARKAGDDDLTPDSKDESDCEPQGYEFDCISKVNAQVVKMYFRVGTQQTKAVTGIAVAGSHVILPAHYLYQNLNGGHVMDTAIEVDVYRADKFLGTVPFNSGMVGETRQSTDDIAVINLGKTIGPFKNIIKHFVRDGDEHFFYQPVAFVGTQTRDTYCLRTMPSCRPRTRSVNYTMGGQQFTYYNSLVYNMCSQPGDCGHPIVSLNATQPRGIIGLHTYGIATVMRAGCIIVTQEMIKDLMANTRGDPYVTEPPALPHCSDRFTEEVVENLDIGTLPPEKVPNAATKTSFEKSPAYETHELWAPNKKRPAALAPTYRGDPLALAYAKTETLFFGGDPKACERASNRLICEIAQMKPNMKPRVLKTDEAINGIAGLHYVKSLDMTTSSGYPYVLRKPPGEKGKHWLFKADEAGRAEISDKELRQRLAERLVQASDGHRLESIWQAQLKDEVRLHGKVDALKTRLFCFPPLDYTIACKMFLGAFCSAMMEEFKRSWSAVGMNPHSIDWEDMMSYLEEAGTIGWSGDYSNYDASLSPQFFRTVVCGINLWYKRHDPDWKQWHDTTRETLLRELNTPFVLYRDRLIRHSGGHPSGGSMTTLLNTLRGRWYLLYTWFADPETSLLEIDDHVRAKIFGDDVVVATSREAEKTFTYEKHKNSMSTLGVKFTPPSKIGDRDPTGPIVDQEFISCTTTARPTGDRVGNLKDDSINSLVNWKKKSVSFTQWKMELGQALGRYIHIRGLHEYEMWHQALMDANGIPLPSFWTMEELYRLAPALDMEKCIPHADTVSTETHGVTYEEQPNLEEVASSYRVPSAPAHASAADLDWSIAGMADKITYKETIEWVGSQARGHILYEKEIPWDVITSSQQDTAFTSFVYWRGDVLIKMIPTATPFHQGQLIAYFSPMARKLSTGDTATDKFVYDVQNSAMLMNHVLFEPHESQPVTFLIPFRHQLNYLVRTDKTNQRLGRFYIMVWNPLRFSNATSPKVPISISISFPSSSFRVPVPTTTISLSGEEAESYLMWKQRNARHFRAPVGARLVERKQAMDPLPEEAEERYIEEEYVEDEQDCVPHGCCCSTEAEEYPEILQPPHHPTYYTITKVGDQNYVWCKDDLEEFVTDLKTLEWTIEDEMDVIPHGLTQSHPHSATARTATLIVVGSSPAMRDYPHVVEAICNCIALNQHRTRYAAPYMYTIFGRAGRVEGQLRVNTQSGVAEVSVYPRTWLPLTAENMHEIDEALGASIPLHTLSAFRPEMSRSQRRRARRRAARLEHRTRSADLQPAPQEIVDIDDLPVEPHGNNSSHSKVNQYFMGDNNKGDVRTKGSEATMQTEANVSVPVQSGMSGMTSGHGGGGGGGGGIGGGGPLETIGASLGAVGDTIKDMHDTGYGSKNDRSRGGRFSARGGRTGTRSGKFDTKSGGMSTLDKPNWPLNPFPVLRAGFANMPGVSGTEFNTKMTFHPHSVQYVFPETFGGEGECSFKNLSKRMSRLAVFEWTVGQAADTNLWSTSIQPVFPNGGPSQKAVLDNHTILDFLYFPFNYWTGGLIYIVQFVATRFHTGKLWFAVSYGSDTDPTGQSIYQQYGTLLSFGESQKFYSILVPYRAATPYKHISNGPIPSGTEGSRYFHNGRVGLYVNVPLVAGSGVATTVEVNVYVAAADDFEVFGVGCNNQDITASYSDSARSPFMEYTSTWPPDPANEEEDELECEPHSQEAPSLSNGTPPPTITIGGPNPVDYHVHHGDPVEDINEVCKRFSFSGTYELNEAMTAYTPLGNKISFTIYPLNTIFRITGRGKFDGHLCAHGWASVYSVAYQGFRGSLRFKIISHGRDQSKQVTTPISVTGDIYNTDDTPAIVNTVNLSMANPNPAPVTTRHTGTLWAIYLPPGFAKLEASDIARARQTIAAMIFCQFGKPNIGGSEMNSFRGALQVAAPGASYLQIEVPYNSIFNFAQLPIDTPDFTSDEFQLGHLVIGTTFQDNPSISSTEYVDIYVAFGDESRMGMLKGLPYLKTAGFRHWSPGTLRTDHLFPAWGTRRPAATAPYPPYVPPSEEEEADTDSSFAMCSRSSFDRELDKIASELESYI